MAGRVRAWVRGWFTVIPGERPLSWIVLIYFAPIAVLLTVGAIVSLVLGPSPRGGQLTNIAGLLYGTVMLSVIVPIVRRRGTPAHLVVLALLTVPSSWFDAWLMNSPTTWRRALIPLVIAAAATADLAWRLYRRRHPTPPTNGQPPPSQQNRLTALPDDGPPLPRPGTLEALQDEIRAATTDRVSIWAPHDITYGGAAVPDQPSGLTAAILLDTALDAGLLPDSTTQGPDGDTYRFRRPYAAATTQPDVDPDETDRSRP